MEELESAYNLLTLDFANLMRFLNRKIAEPSESKKRLSEMLDESSSEEEEVPEAPKVNIFLYFFCGTNLYSTSV